MFEYLGLREFDRVTCVSGTEHNSIEQSEEDKDFMTYEVPIVACVWHVDACQWHRVKLNRTEWS